MSRPSFPVGSDHFGHFLARMVQPLGRALPQVAQYSLACGLRSQVNVCGFPAHRMKQIEFIFRLGQRSQRNAAAIRCQSAQEPMPGYPDERVGDSNGLIDNLLVKDRGPARRGLLPMRRRHPKFFGFPCNSAPLPLSQCSKTPPSQAPQPSLAVDSAKG